MTAAPAASSHLPVTAPVAWRIVGSLAAFCLLLHLATNVFTPYGIHRDELLYLAMGRHLRLFHMDFPPAIAILAEFSRRTLGDSLWAIRFFPALAGATMVVLAALVAREMGGRRFAQSLAAIAVLTNQLFLRAANLYQPVVLDQLAWTVALYALVRLIRSADSKWWIVFGVAMGFGLLAKFSILFFGLAALVALVVTSERRWLFTPWPWIAMAITLVLGSPSILGQINLGYPVLGQMRDLRTVQLERV